MKDEIVDQVVLAIKEKLRKLSIGPGQRFALVALAEVQGKFPGGYFHEALNRLMEQGAISQDLGSMSRFLTLTEEGYLELWR